MTREFITENKDYKLIFNKRISKFTNANIFSCEIVNSIDSKLLEFNFSYIDLLNIIDNIEEFLSNDTDIYYSRNCNEKVYILGLFPQDTDTSLVKKPEDFYIKDVMSVSTYRNDLIVKILSFEVTATLTNLLQIVYELIWKLKNIRLLTFR